MNIYKVKFNNKKKKEEEIESEISYHRTFDQNKKKKNKKLKISKQIFINNNKINIK